MRKVFAFAPLLAVLWCQLLVPAAVRAEERDRVRRARSFDHRFDLVDAPARLLVDNLFGEIRVTAGEPGRIVATIHETIRARDATRADAASREVSVVPTQSGGSVELFVEGPFRDRRDRSSWRRHDDPGYRVRYDFEIEVPVRTQLTLRTVTEGDIEVLGVRGDFHLNNVNGSVRLKGADGAGSIETVNGGVEAVFVSAPSGDSWFETVNGSIEIGVPEGTGAELALQSRFGELSSDFPFELIPGTEVVEETTDSGSRRFRVGGFTVARIGGGGPRLQLETLNGDVLIRRAR